MERTTRLAALGADGLAQLLQRRPDVLLGRPPRTLTELAQRLDAAASVAAACWRLDAARLQVLVAAAAFAGGVCVERLSGLIDGDPRPQLTALVELDLVSFDGDTARVHPAVRRCAPDPFGLGPPFVDIAEAFPHRLLKRAERAFGLPAGPNKRATVEALAQVYADADLLRPARVRAAPNPSSSRCSHAPPGPTPTTSTSTTTSSTTTTAAMRSTTGSATRSSTRSASTPAC